MELRPKTFIRFLEFVAFLQIKHSFSDQNRRCDVAELSLALGSADVVFPWFGLGVRKTASASRLGVAVDWRRTGVPSYGHRQLPNNFLFLTEMHFGGCGTYTSSDRWKDAYGAAIDLR